MENSAINATINANNAAVGAGDMDAILATFEENGVLIGQPGMAAQGTPALRTAFAGFMAIKPQITVTAHEVIQADDIALHNSTWTMTGTTPDGSAIEQSGYSVVVLRRQDDGAWLRFIDNPFGHLLTQAS